MPIQFFAGDKKQTGSSSGRAPQGRAVVTRFFIARRHNKKELKQATPFLTQTPYQQPRHEGSSCYFFQFFTTKVVLGYVVRGIIFAHIPYL